MLDLRLNWFVLVCTAAAQLAWIGCSVDAGLNDGWGCDDTCSECYMGFCLRADGETIRDGGGDASADSGAEPTLCDEEGAIELCYEGDPSTARQEPCRAGTRTCERGSWTTCQDQVTPKDEECNGVDDNCNGEIDEQIAIATCTVEERAGACQEGVRLCRAGATSCIPVVFPKAEVCNGIDDDCDGLSDEDDPDLIEACYPEDTAGCVVDANGRYTCSGLCSTGTRRCIEGVRETSCQNAITPAEESGTTPGDVVTDEDCDGFSDEGFECEDEEQYACYAGPAGTRGVGPCAAGTQTCTGGKLDECQDQVLPTFETCANEGEDDNCNGKPDDIPSRGNFCDNPGSGNQCMANARWDCYGESFECVPAAKEQETCDAVDNDCDNKVDEDFDLDSDPNHCGGCNLACAEGLTCCGGACVSTQSSNSHCGACGNACKDGLTCCSGTCVRTNTIQNCQGCGIQCVPVVEACTSTGCRVLGLL